MVRQRSMIFTLIMVIVFAPIRVCYGDGVIPGGEDPGEPGPAPAPRIDISSVNGLFAPIPYQVTGATPNDFYHARLKKYNGNPVAPAYNIVAYTAGTTNVQGNGAGLFGMVGPSWGNPSRYHARLYDFNQGFEYGGFNTIDFP